MTTAACPRCGGQGTALAPGYYNCTATVLVDVIPPGAQGNLGAVPLYEPCGTRFQTSEAGSSGRQCDCGFYAVGSCTSCGKPLCGRHKVEQGGRLLCENDAQVEREAHRRAAEEAHRREAEARRRAVAQWEHLAAQALRAVPNDVERLVRAISEIKHAETEELRRLIPTKWEDRAVVAWFLVAVGQRPPHDVPLDSQGSRRTRTAPGWFFPNGSRGQRQSAPKSASLALLPSGEVLYDGSKTAHPDDGISAGTLQRMGTYVGLQPLALPPRPGISLAQKEATRVPYPAVDGDRPPAPVPVPVQRRHRMFRTSVTLAVLMLSAGMVSQHPDSRRWLDKQLGPRQAAAAGELLFPGATCTGDRSEGGHYHPTCRLEVAGVSKMWVDVELRPNRKTVGTGAEAGYRPTPQNENNDYRPVQDEILLACAGTRSVMRDFADNAPDYRSYYVTGRRSGKPYYCSTTIALIEHGEPSQSLRPSARLEVLDPRSGWAVGVSIPNSWQGNDPSRNSRWNRTEPVTKAEWKAFWRVAEGVLSRTAASPVKGCWYLWCEQL